MKQILPEEPLPIALRYLFVSDAADARLKKSESSKTAFVGSVLKYLTYRWPDRAALAKSERVVATYLSGGGEPYATAYLVPEAFETSGGARISAKLLRERLPETLRLAELRQRTIYGVTSKKRIEPVLQSYRDFVDLCERVELKTGEPVLISASC